MNTKPTFDELERRVKELEKKLAGLEQAKEALKGLDQRYKDLIEELPAMYVITQRHEGVPIIENCNELFLRSLGYCREQVLNRPLSDFYISESKERLFAEGYTKALEGHFADEERGLVTSNGHIMETLLRAFPVRDSKGDVVGTQAIYLDITVRKRAEEALRESEEKYKILTESSQTGIYIHQDEILVYANNRFAELHGYTVQELLGTNYFDLFDPIDRERTREIKSRRLKGEAAPRVHETKRIRKDGSPLWCLTEAVRIEYQGKPAIMGNIVDITERKLAEKQRDEFVLKLQEALTKVETLSAISQIVNRSLNLDQILNDALDKVIELFKPHSAYIRLLDAEKQELVFVAQKGLNSEELKLVTQRLKLEHAIASHAIQSGEAVAIEDVLTDPRAVIGRSFAKLIGCRSVVTIILYAKNTIVGNMSIRWREPNAFIADKIQLFTSIGNLIGTAIENANLFKQVQRNTEVLTALNSVSNTVSQTLDIEKLTGDVLDKVIEVLHSDAGTIRLIDETHQTLEVIAHKGFSEEQAKKMNIKRNCGEGLAWQCLESNQVIFTEFNPEDSYQQKIKSFGMQIGARCAVHFPIVYKDVKLGIMTIYSFSFQAFSEEEIGLCINIGRQVGIAIENARLYQQAQYNIKALKDSHAEREQIIVKLQNALAEVKTLGELLPICSYCKNIRDDKGYWNKIEAYIHKRSGTEFSHSICPECMKKHYPEYVDDSV